MAEPSGQFRGKGTHTHGEKTVEVTFHACGYKKKASGTSSSPEASIKTAATYSPTVTQYHRRDKA
mgnify:FL=1